MPMSNEMSYYFILYLISYCPEEYIYIKFAHTHLINGSYFGIFDIRKDHVQNFWV